MAKFRFVAAHESSAGLIRIFDHFYLHCNVAQHKLSQQQTCFEIYYLRYTICTGNYLIVYVCVQISGMKLV